MFEQYIYVIVALLPLTSLMLVLQVNPYNALVMRAIVGAIATLVYVVLGAADVALTEALVGTMLAVTLYAIAIRSSLVMRLGIRPQDLAESEGYFTELRAKLKKILHPYHLRLEISEYPSDRDLNQALASAEIHAICYPEQDAGSSSETKYRLAIRVHRLWEIMQKELNSPEVALSYVRTCSPNEFESLYRPINFSEKQE
jgi:putative multicomponent Na+:H+ antiporter subunit B